MNFFQGHLLQSRRMIESMMAVMHEGALVLNSENNIEIANEAAAQQLGFLTAEELTGKHFYSLCAYPEEANDIIDDIDLNGRFDDREKTFVRTDGRTFKGSSSGLRIQDAESTVFFKIILVRDITDKDAAEQKLAEYTKRLEKNNKELSQFAYIVSHDLKAPLRAIANLSAWLKEDLGSSLLDENKKNMDMLNSRAIRLESLINGILEYSKIGREQILSERVDIYTLLSEVVEMLCPPENIQVQISDKMPVLDAPKIMLLQVFSNLIGNAIKYNNKAQGEIKVYYSEKDDCYEFVVEDNGPGIPSEFFEKIFVIFQTLQSRDKFESTGIGLTIVKRIIEDRGGKIWIESTLEIGSKFIFHWPKRSDR